MNRSPRRRIAVPPRAPASEGSSEAASEQAADGIGEDRPVHPDAEPLQQPPWTGDPLVDEALAAAVAVGDADPAEQLETYVGTHRSLQARLADSGA